MYAEHPSHLNTTTGRREDSSSVANINAKLRSTADIQNERHLSITILRIDRDTKQTRVTHQSFQQPKVSRKTREVEHTLSKRAPKEPDNHGSISPFCPVVLPVIMNGPVYSLNQLSLPRSGYNAWRMEEVLLTPLTRCTLVR